MRRTGKKVGHSVHMLPAEVQSGHALPSCFASPNVNKCSFNCLFSVTCFAFLCCLLVSFLFKMAPRCSAEVLSSVPKHKNTVMCLAEKIYLR